MKTFGGILLVIGVILLLYAISMDTSVPVEYENGNSYGFPERVNNIGLMNDKSNYTLISIGMIIASVIMISIKSSDKEEKNSYRDNLLMFKKYKNLAENDVENGNYSSAIENYMTTINHLEKDFKNLSQSDELNRQVLIDNIKLKIIELKLKV